MPATPRLEERTWLPSPGEARRVAAVAPELGPAPSPGDLPRVPEPRAPGIGGGGPCESWERQADMLLLAQ
eukprot:CAMPEP_0178404534 /NCGR_PEP_ID=MMETSP0689_2-20121128/17935_1 /TAXON_ID=160604 /ORGANISM="Amphidinium massartii, Strain CS-259" /LENGTH=69 /DNA_ID=CAMNT_0020025525 /DNA_START=174 /DNA_END=383 /DNA_ORIENTATION=-